VLGGLLGLVATLMVGMAAEVIAMRRLYGCDHLDHVLGTSGVDPVFDGAVRLIWGPEGLSLCRCHPGSTPRCRFCSAYRLAIIIVSLTVAAFLYFLVMRTRIGMLIRADASNRRLWRACPDRSPSHVPGTNVQSPPLISSIWNADRLRPK
jgi:branched-chain amino acid transport system permease protein